MSLAELSNSMLAHMINADPSMISRFRRGHRTPKSSSSAVMLICRVLVERITELGKTEPPYLSFTFLHPLMCEAFRAYVKEMG